MTTLFKGTALGAGAVLCAALFAGAAAAQDFTFVNNHGDITPLCGTDPIRVALIDGFGGNAWRTTAFAEIQDEASKCANITEVTYADAGGDIQAYNAAINGFVSQGYEIIVTFTDFGDAAIPAYRAAKLAGTTMVPYFSDLSGEIGVDYDANPYEDAYAAGTIFGEWVGAALNGEGTTVFLGGLPGSASSTTFLEGYKNGLSAYPGITLLDENFIVTNWNPADAQRAVAGLIATYPEIDAIASDYGVTSLAAVKAFEAAGLPVPAMAFIATNNEYSCHYMDVAAENRWPQLALSGTTADVRFALRAGLAARNGMENPEPRALVAFPYANSVEGIDPVCDPSMPPDADLASSLPADALRALFAQ